jgi:mannose-6-phosphate isomerase
LWHILDVNPGARIFVGFNKDMTAQELYDRCKNGTIEEVLNVIYPKKGDSLIITPGTVHAADGGILLTEIQESSDMTFRLYDWGRELNPATARPLHLEEAIDMVDYRKFDQSNYIKGPLWEKECHCHEDECHCHEDKVAETLMERAEFSVTKLNLTDPLHIYTEQFESFIVYVCIEGAASIQVPSTDANGQACMGNYELAKGETILVPADMSDFFLVPRDKETVLLEAVCRPQEIDDYIDPNTEAFLEGEDYEGLEDEIEDDDEQIGPAGASPLNFFS